MSDVEDLEASIKATNDTIYGLIHSVEKRAEELRQLKRKVRLST